MFDEHTREQLADFLGFAPDGEHVAVHLLETRSRDELSFDRLKSDQVEAMRADDDSEKLQGWSVYRCIVFEIQRDGELYTLSAGQWYRVSLDFKDEVYAFANALPSI